MPPCLLTQSTIAFACASVLPMLFRPWMPLAWLTALTLLAWKKPIRTVVGVTPTGSPAPDAAAVEPAGPAVLLPVRPAAAPAEPAVPGRAAPLAPAAADPEPPSAAAPAEPGTAIETTL